MKPIFYLLMLVPSMLSAEICSHDSFDFYTSIEKHITYYEDQLREMNLPQLEMDEITEKDRQVFFSGCLESLHSVQSNFILYESHR